MSLSSSVGSRSINVSLVGESDRMVTVLDDVLILTDGLLPLSEKSVLLKKDRRVSSNQAAYIITQPTERAEVAELCIEPQLHVTTDSPPLWVTQQRKPRFHAWRSASFCLIQSGRSHASTLGIPFPELTFEPSPV